MKRNKYLKVGGNLSEYIEYYDKRIPIVIVWVIAPESFKPCLMEFSISGGLYPYIELILNQKLVFGFYD